MASLICSICNENPRAAPGQPCNPCKAQRLKLWRAGQPGPSAQKAAPPVKGKRFTRPLNAKRYLITSAQNATAIDGPFFDVLKIAAAAMGAELVVIPFRYKNPTSIWSSKQQDEEWWDPAVTPYLHNTRKKLGPSLVLAADVKIQPTASSPVSGFESLTGAESCILGHPKMQLRCIPAPTGRQAKILTTTGACTKKNYTDTKAGKLGAFHHFLGAIVVELDGTRFHLRQINADRADGSFIDLDQLYTLTGVSKAPRALALDQGDTHARFTCPDVDRATHGPGGMVAVLDPEVLIYHDLFDGYEVNPHHAGDPFIAEAKAQAGMGVREEVEHAIEFVRARLSGRKAVIVPSNHDNFLARWIRSTDWRTCAAKAFYLETAAAMLRSVRMGPGGAEYADPFKYWVDRRKGDAAIRALELDDSFNVAGIECGQHGDRGPNGSRGTLKNNSRLGAKMMTGHTHTPGIEEGHYQLGTSSVLRLEYAHGPSSWRNAHGVVYANGKRSLLFVNDGRWRAT